MRTTIILSLVLLCLVRIQAAEPRPNIILAISDDQSWCHTGATGDTGIKTPAFDRIAAEGVLYTHAYTAAPRCSPARSSLFASQPGWRIGTSITHYANTGTDRGFSCPNWARVLEDNGYRIGGSGRKSGEVRGWGDVPYKRLADVRKEFDDNDGNASFRAFLDQTDSSKPFLWYWAPTLGHRSFDQGSGLEEGYQLSDALVPGNIPDNDTTRSDILDYYLEIEEFDKHIALMMEHLEAIGELENTIIIVSSDNGYAFPTGKGTLYDTGVRMPFAVRWGDQIPGGRVIDDFIGLWDIGPTLLDAAGVEAQTDAYGRSLLPALTGNQEGRVEADRDFAITVKEMCAYVRPHGLYPQRALHTADWVYIRNFYPERWPMGNENFPAEFGEFSDTDGSPSKNHILQNREEVGPSGANYFQLAFGRLPGEMLFDMRNDPWQLNNLADDPAYADVLAELRDTMETHLTETGDPRFTGAERMPWEVPYFSGKGPHFWVSTYEDQLKNNTYDENLAWARDYFGDSYGRKGTFTGNDTILDPGIAAPSNLQATLLE